MHVHFIIHESFEAPGSYEAWAKASGYTITYSRVYEGDSLPQDINHIDFLIVMGGPQGPDTTISECPHFDSSGEQDVIARAIRANKVVIGVCLGAQLIGEALGAKCERSPEREIGKFPMSMTPTGLAHPLFSHFGKELEVGHWHNDMPGLTDNAEIIAYSEGCPRQIIAYGRLVFGFQCHMEFTRELVGLLIENDDLSKASEYRFVDEPEVLLNHNYSDMNRKLHEFLEKLVVWYQSKPNDSGSLVG